jgi:phosphoribosyl 1,2-cyclic phosphodiesterase
VRYGGNTSCVAIAHDGRSPSLVLDGGTGLRRLSNLLDPAPFLGTILLGHLHWDHTHGLPFFPAADHPDSQVRVLLPGQGDPVEVLSRAMGPPHFPLRPDQLRGRWTFESLEPGEHELEGFAVRVRSIPHLEAKTFGFQVSDGSASVAYLSDHNPIGLGPGPEGLGPYHDDAMDLARGADVLFHDAQHTAAELPAKAFFGHSAAEYAVGLAVAAGVPRVVLYHHDPTRTDDEVDAIVRANQRPGVMVEGAVEGSTIDVAG